jgi:YesN/AraC family two-component response regulator
MAKILIVDDSTVMRKNLHSIFVKNGHEVVGEANNGVQALALYKELTPDLITMDITMPKMNGVDAVKQIVESDKNAKIIMVSALNQKQMVFEALRNGAKHYITKPIEATKLMGVVNEVLNENMSEEEIVENKKESTQITKAKPGFIIENIEGSFIIKFDEHFDNDDMNKLDTAIKGLLFITPLKVVFDLENNKPLSEEIMMGINKLGNSIKNAGGFLKFSSEE